MYMDESLPRSVAVIGLAFERYLEFCVPSEGQTTA
jgi:hypothetical protein